MSEAGDYDPGPWRGHDFKDARKAYDAHVGRSYGDALATGKTKTDLLEPSLKTKSTNPLAIICDVTGSMGEWPAVMFSKLPYLEIEGKEYLGKDMEISFAAVGDAYSDNYPLQVRKYASGKDLEKRLKELVIEGNGGGQTCESYDLAALYYARKVEMPDAIKPITIFIGDEGLYDLVNPDQAKTLLGMSLEKVSSRDVFEELKRKSAVYLIRKPYGSGDSDSTNQRIQAQWESYLGADHVAMLPEAGRVVDVIFGILAKETSRVDYFRKELKGRQTPKQVDTVLKTLHTIHDLSAKKTVKKLGKGKSVLRRK